MAANYQSCDLNALLTASTCFWSCLKEEEILAVELYVRIMEFAGLGTDYTGKAGLLRLQQDSGAWNSQVLDPIKRQGVALYIDQQNAINNNAATISDAKAAKAASACYSCIPFESKKNLLLFLKCKMNSVNKPE